MINRLFPPIIFNYKQVTNCYITTYRAALLYISIVSLQVHIIQFFGTNRVH